MNQYAKNFVSLLIAVAIFAVFSLLTGCSDPAAEQVQEQQKAQADGLDKFMHQGNGKVRKPGESGFKSF